VTVVPRFRLAVLTGSRERGRRLARLAALLPLVSGLPACAAREPLVHRTVITIHHSRFQPAHLNVELGSRHVFVIRNTDPIDHEFILGNEAVQARHESGTEPHHGTVPGEVSVPIGSQASTTYTFSVPGDLEFACHLPGHYAYGMRGSVSIRR
jgi:uncharacterized cupredoxin-like copper-binding protein